MYPSINELKELLLREHYVSEQDSKAAEAASQDSSGYVEFLIRQELLTKKLLGQALAEGYKLPFTELAINSAARENIQVIPEAIAWANRVVFVKGNDRVVAIATDTPEKVNVKQLESLFPGKKIRLVYALPEQIAASFSLYEQPLATRFADIISAGKRVAPEIVDEIIKDALAYRASDIHFEPRSTEVIVRFRIDGDLRDAGKLPKNNYENVLNRIKVESNMRIDEHFSAQGGSIKRQIDDYSVDLRISLVPTVEGEKVAMRILGSYVQDFTLADIGLSPIHRTMIELHASKLFGMILTVGPTGSGKTTTTYSMVKLLNRANVNITSIEDPVEYKIANINQIQIHEQTNLTFANGLRAVVRQDPDVILVGEVRDKETADISVNAALIGHLIFSTFNASDTATAIPRLIEMGIEPFLLASTLELLIAQRLVRKICNGCRYSLPISEALSGLRPSKNNLAEIFRYFSKTDTVYAGKGCPLCSGTGYSGRSALFEFLEVSAEIQDLIIKRPSAGEIETLARAQGSRSMFEDGMEKVKTGLTTISEVIRVAAPPRRAKE